MKSKHWFSILIVLVILFITTVPVLAAPAVIPFREGGGDPLTVTETQILYIGIVAVIVTQALKYLFATQWGKKIDRKWVTVGLFVIALILAYLWAAPLLPAWPALMDDPGLYAIEIIGWIGKLVLVASTVIGFAKLIYDLLLAKVFDALGWGSQKIERLTLPK
jgi:hypothetical protein